MRIALLLSLTVAASAAVKLPAVISDHMVLQAGTPVRVWGWADPGEAVTVSVEGQSAGAVAGANGKWTAWLRPLIAGGPMEMTVNSTVVHDVLVGEVWLGSGQSNMELRLATAANHDEEIARADHPLIRLFQVKHAVADQPAEDVSGAWRVCSPESAKGFSAVAYFFGRNLQENLHVPVGLMESDWGGTPAEAWTSHDALAGDPALGYVATEWQATLDKYPDAKKRYDEQLAGWEKDAAVARDTGKTPPNRPAAPPGPGHQYTPSGLYNGMIAPLTPYGIRGVIWYQGEQNGNEGHAFRYRRLFAAMIEDWRNQFGQGDFPFLFVQLANYKTNGWWPVLRESQNEALRLSNTAEAVIIDIGNPTNIHPTNKQDVGLRLALAARAMTYHEAVEYSGPVFRAAAVEDRRMQVYFTHAGGMRASGGEWVTGFEVAGADGKFAAAEAKIEGDEIVVSSAEVSAPTQVRYAWADNPTCNLVNAAGLPASPFRSGR